LEKEFKKILQEKDQLQSEKLILTERANKMKIQI